MDTILTIIAIIAVVIGTFFSLTGVLGYIRFPDVYTRLHATAKVSVFGAVLLMVAAISLTPLSFGKGLILISLLLISGPVISHTLASAAYRIGVPLNPAGRDDLKNTIQEQAQADQNPVTGKYQE
jgi:multicomponent Na+:H+ antiporter subunit G